MSAAGAGAGGDLRGPLWMLGNAAVFSMQVTLIKSAQEVVPMSTILLFMVGVQGVVVWLLNAREVNDIFRPGRRHAPHLWRSAMMVIGVSTGVSSVAFLPVAEATALSFCKPLFVTILAALVLREMVGPRRAFAVALGFGGVLILAQPTGEAMSAVGLGLGIASALSSAIAVVTTRVLARSEPASVLLMYQTGLGVLVFLPWAILEWDTPDAAGFGLLLLIGGFSLVGNLATILALRYGEASVIAPVDFTRAVFAALFAFVLLGEVPTTATLIGTAVIMVGALIALRRQAQA
ncbi:DMT family transporter [Tropicimonas sp. IMCC34011]|uniref:DMT family transporter n=1 Tax=Tropicimonas sp. IMCC34011 TaxID=2248759 RepID=UPI000E23A133|nr:DMT family transporter [Tropicimonas sp. IMCC34011]